MTRTCNHCNAKFDAPRHQVTICDECLYQNCVSCDTRFRTTTQQRRNPISTADLNFRDRNQGKVVTKMPTYEPVSTRMYKRLAAEALDKLSGDLSYDNVAVVKQILKRIVG